VTGTRPAPSLVLVLPLPRRNPLFCVFFSAMANDLQSCYLVYRSSRLRATCLFQVYSGPPCTLIWFYSYLHCLIGFCPNSHQNACNWVPPVGFFVPTPVLSPPLGSLCTYSLSPKCVRVVYSAYFSQGNPFSCLLRGSVLNLSPPSQGFFLFCSFFLCMPLILCLSDLFFLWDINRGDCL